MQMRGEDEDLAIRLTGIATKQYGLITAKQLRALGVSRNYVRSRVDRRLWHCIYPRVYAVGYHRYDEMAQWLAAVLATGESAVLSHRSAAVLWRVWQRRVPCISVSSEQGRAVPIRARGSTASTQDGRSSFYRNPIELHRTTLASDEVTVERGIPITTFPRTCLDICASLTVQQVAKVLHEGAYRGLYQHRAITKVLARHHRHRHIRVLRRAVEIVEHGGRGTRSSLEDRALVAFREAALPEPIVNTCVQVPFDPGDILSSGNTIGARPMAAAPDGSTTGTGVRASSHRLEVDLLWPAERLVVEIDGPGHQRAITRARDRQRDAALRAAGYHVLRIPWHHIRPDASRAIARVQAALLDRSAR